MEDLSDLGAIRVLVVDDEPFMRGIIKRFLGVIGLTDVSEAADGADGLTKVQTDKPDLVILDIHMEPMNGLKFLKAVRVGMSGADHDLPVVVLTGATDGAVLGTALALDCDAFVRKSEGAEVLTDRIRRVLAEKSAIKDSTAYLGVRIPDITIDIGAPPPRRVAEGKPSQAMETTIDEVEAGAVLDRDVYTEEGHLLFAAGTRLGGSHLNRLKDIAGIIDLPPLWVRRS